MPTPPIDSGDFGSHVHDWHNALGPQFLEFLTCSNFSSLPPQVTVQLFHQSWNLDFKYSVLWQQLPILPDNMFENNRCNSFPTSLTPFKLRLHCFVIIHLFSSFPSICGLDFIAHSYHCFLANIFSSLGPLCCNGLARLLVHVCTHCLLFTILPRLLTFNSWIASYLYETTEAIIFPPTNLDIYLDFRLSSILSC